MGLNFGSLFGRSVSEALSPNKDALTGDWQWITENGTRILASGQGNNSTVTIYTVPTGKVFYLSSAVLSLATNGVANGTSAAVMGGSTAMRIDAINIQTTNAVNMALPFPIKFVAAETLRVQSTNAAVFTHLTISGYEVDA